MTQLESLKKLIGSDYEDRRDFENALIEAMDTENNVQVLNFEEEHGTNADAWHVWEDDTDNAFCVITEYEGRQNECCFEGPNNFQKIIIISVS